MNTKQTKRERRAAQLLAHYDKCEALARHLGHPKPNGKRISVALLKIEQDAHNAATAQCNGEAFGNQPYRDEDQWETFKRVTSGKVAQALGQVPVGFFVNGDARGYALKIDNDNPQGKSLIDDLRLHRDWGGYGILSPDITGD